MAQIFSTKSSAAGLSIASNALVVSLELAAGILTGSMSIISGAINSVLDLFAAIITFFSVRGADKPADERHSFGHGKLENIGGIIEAVLIFVAATWIIFEAVGRIVRGARVELLEVGIGIMLASMVINILVSRHLLRVARATDSIALEADARHLIADVYISVGVLLGLVTVRLTDINILDSLIALGVAVLILRTAYILTRRSFPGLMDVRLPFTEETEIRKSIAEHCGELVGFHALRTRKSGAERHIDLHLVMAKYMHLEEAHQMADHLEEDIKAKLPRASVTIHLEPCGEGCEQCPVVSCAERKGGTVTRGFRFLL